MAKSPASLSSALREGLSSSWKLFAVPYKELVKFYGWRLAVLIAAMTLVTLLEGLGLALLLPLLFALGLVQAGDAGPLFQMISDFVRVVGLPSSPIALGMITVGVLLTQTAFSLLQGIEIVRIQTRYNHSVRERVFGNLLQSHWRSLNQTDVSEMLNSMMGEPQKVATALGYWLQMLTQLLTIGVYLGLAFLSSWKLSLFLASLGLLQGLLAQGTVLRARELGVRLAQATEPYSAWVGQLMYGLKLVKATGSEEFCEREFRVAGQKLIQEERHTAQAPLYLRFFLEIGGALSLIACLLLAKLALNLDSISTLFIFGIFYRIFPRLTTIQQMLQGISMYLPALDYISRVETRAIRAKEPLQKPNASQALTSFGKIRVENAIVRYGEAHALRGASLEIPKNALVGIVGRSGSGKTTLLDCLMGLLTPDEGRVFVDQRALGDLSLSAWRSSIGYVGQDTIVFNASIRENIVWNLPEPPLDEVRQAARLADADEFISSFPSAYETQVGDRGSRVSGGQRQRIGIARALMRKPSILLMDEATSSLDPVSEAEIMRTLHKLKSAVTVAFVTHRIASLKNADLIYVMEEGKVVDQGTYEELSRKSAAFKRLIDDKNHLTTEPHAVLSP